MVQMKDNMSIQTSAPSFNRLDFLLANLRNELDEQKILDAKLARGLGSMKEAVAELKKSRQTTPNRIVTVERISDNRAAITVRENDPISDAVINSLENQLEESNSNHSLCSSGYMSSMLSLAKLNSDVEKQENSENKTENKTTTNVTAINSRLKASVSSGGLSKITEHKGRKIKYFRPAPKIPSKLSNKIPPVHDEVQKLKPVSQLTQHKCNLLLPSSKLNYSSGFSAKNNTSYDLLEKTLKDLDFMQTEFTTKNSTKVPEKVENSAKPKLENKIQENKTNLSEKLADVKIQATVSPTSVNRRLEFSGDYEDYEGLGIGQPSEDLCTIDTSWIDSFR